jgi:DNA-binding beta-propeller fold protein YncE
MKCRLLFLHLFMITAVISAQTGNYKLLKRFAVPGDGSWDYLTLDSGARRLYVSHGTRVEVLSADTGEKIGIIPNTPGVHGIALAGAYGFTTNGASNTSTMFDTKTLAVRKTIRTGEGPDAVLYDPGSRRVFTFNGEGNDATAIDSLTGDVAGKVALGGAPESGVSDGKGTVFVNLEDKNQVTVFDSRKLGVLHHWPVAGCRQPVSMTMDVAHERLFIGCRSKVMVVMNAMNGKVVATVPIGDHVDASAFDPATSLLYESNGDGTLTIIHQDSVDQYRVIQTVQTQPGAKTMAYDPKSREVFLSVADYGPSHAVASGTFKVLVMGPAPTR